MLMVKNMLLAGKMLFLRQFSSYPNEQPPQSGASQSTFIKMSLSKKAFSKLLSKKRHFYDIYL